MTVQELIELLKQFPQELEVELWADDGDPTPKPEEWSGKVML